MATASPKPQNTNTEPRLHALDSLRGVMALIVLLWHCYATLGHELWVMITPLRIFADGRAAVIVFFVLSGFVLALPYLRGNALPYRTFLVRRLCRIYPAFAAAILMAAGLHIMTADLPVSGAWLTKWPAADPLGWTHVVQTLAMTGTLPSGLQLNGPIWSLIVEMKVSIIFPVLILLCRRSWIGVAVMIGIGAATANVLSPDDMLAGQDPHPLVSTFLIAAYFLPCFLFGILLARHRDIIIARLAALSLEKAALLWLAVFLVFYLFNDYEKRTLHTLAAGLLMMLCLASQNAAGLLQAPALRWLGRISYSLYLVHLPILYAMIHTLNPHLPPAAIHALGVVASLAAGHLLWRYVEKPGIALGKRFARG